MPLRVPPSLDDLRDLEILVRANHSLIVLDTDEPERAEPLVRWVADRLSLPFVGWAPDRGLFRHDIAKFAVEGSSDPLKCLDYVLAGKGETLYFLESFQPKLDDAMVVHKLATVALQLSNHRGAVLMNAHGAALPAPLRGSPPRSGCPARAPSSTTTSCASCWPIWPAGCRSRSSSAAKKWRACSATCRGSRCSR